MASEPSDRELDAAPDSIDFPDRSLDLRDGEPPGLTWWRLGSHHSVRSKINLLAPVSHQVQPQCGLRLSAEVIAQFRLQGTAGLMLGRGSIRSCRRP